MLVKVLKFIKYGQETGKVNMNVIFYLIAKVLDFFNFFLFSSFSKPSMVEVCLLDCVNKCSFKLSLDLLLGQTC